MHRPDRRHECCGWSRRVVCRAALLPRSPMTGRSRSRTLRSPRGPPVRPKGISCSGFASTTPPPRGRPPANARRSARRRAVRQSDSSNRASTWGLRSQPLIPTIPDGHDRRSSSSAAQPPAGCWWGSSAVERWQFYTVPDSLSQIRACRRRRGRRHCPSCFRPPSVSRRVDLRFLGWFGFSRAASSRSDQRSCGWEYGDRREEP